MVIVQRPTLFRIVPRVEFTIRSACEYEVAEKRIRAALIEGYRRRTTAAQPLCGTFENGELSALVSLPSEPRTKVRARLGVTPDGRAALQGDIRPPLVHLFVLAPVGGIAMTKLVSTLTVSGWLVAAGVVVGILGAMWLAAWSLFPLRVLRTRSVLQRVLREPVPGEDSGALPLPSSAYRSRHPRSRLILRHRARSGE